MTIRTAEVTFIFVSLDTWRYTVHLLVRARPYGPNAVLAARALFPTLLNSDVEHEGRAYGVGTYALKAA